MGKRPCDEFMNSVYMWCMCLYHSHCIVFAFLSGSEFSLILFIWSHSDQFWLLVIPSGSWHFSNLPLCHSYMASGSQQKGSENRMKHGRLRVHPNSNPSLFNQLSTLGSQAQWEAGNGIWELPQHLGLQETTTWLSAVGLSGTGKHCPTASSNGLGHV